MHGVVLAAGRGTRLRPLTDDTPKALVDVAGEPILTRGLRRLVALGVDDLAVVVGYRGDQIRDRYGDRFEGVPVSYARQDDQKGLAHALLRAEHLVADDFLLVHGDNVFDPGADLERVVERHRETGPAATVLVERLSREAAAKTGVVRTDGDRVTGVVEKPDDPPSTLALTGLFALSPAVFHACHLVRPSERGEYELSDALDLLCRAGHPVETVPLEGWRVNVNTPADRREAARRLERNP